MDHSRDQRIDRFAHSSPGSSQAPIVQGGFDRDSNRPCLKNRKLQLSRQLSFKPVGMGSTRFPKVIDPYRRIDNNHEADLIRPSRIAPRSPSHSILPRKRRMPSCPFNIAEDYDSGVDTNARLVAHLIEGEYFVQIRHWNRASGMGNYTVKVRKL